LVSRNLPAVVRIAAVGVAAVLLLWIYDKWNVRFYEPGSATDRTVLIGFTDSTLAAIEEGRYQTALPELGPNPKSRRLLHGRLMEILARTQPRVVVWDYHFPDPQPKYDPAFIRGVKKLKEAGTPVVVGATAFDINGEPLMCAAIREAVDSYGCIVSTNPGSITNEFAVPICIERGFGDPIPGILVSAVAAWYHGDCDADLRLDPTQVTIRYRLREVRRGQRSHLDETDTIDVSEVDTITLMFPIISRPRRIGTLEADDRVYVTRVDAGDSARWSQTMVAYEDVLAADDRQLREWFAGRAVLIGEMLEGSRDEHEIRPGGARVFGCQVFAQAIDAQLSKKRLRPLTSNDVGLRVGVWCALAALLVGLVPVGRRQSFPLTAWGCVMACLFGLLLAVTGAQWLTRVWLVEPLMGLSTLLSAGSLAYLARAARERQLRLAPDWYVVPVDSVDLPTTVLAEAQ
jgi:CHASE2 domain-containing sensor protein